MNKCRLGVGVFCVFGIVILVGLLGCNGIAVKPPTGDGGNVVTSNVTLPSFSATATGQSVLLAWGASSDVKLIAIRRGTSGYPTTVHEGDAVVTVNIATSGASSTMDLNLSPRTLYYYSLFAMDVHDHYASNYAIVNVRTLPLPVSGVVGTNDLEKVRFSWTSPPDSVDTDRVIIRASTLLFPENLQEGSAIFSGAGQQTTGNLYFDDGNYATTYNYSIFVQTAAGALSKPVHYSMYRAPLFPYFLFFGEISESGELTFSFNSRLNAGNYFKNFLIVGNTNARPQNRSDGEVYFSSATEYRASFFVHKTGLDYTKKYYVRLFLVDKNDREIPYSPDDSFFSDTSSTPAIN